MKALTRSGLSTKARDTTIYQVAERAGVSIATVSRVLRGTARVAPATRAARAESAVRGPAVHAQPVGSLAGRGPARGRRDRLPRPVRALLRRGRARLRGGRRRARPQRADPVDPRPRGGRARWSLDLASRVDGMVVLGPHRRRRRARRPGAPRSSPLVLIARDAVPGADSVNAENERSAERWHDHLVADHGYRSIAFLGDAAIVATTRPDAGRASARCSRDARPAVGRRRGRPVRLRRGGRSAAPPTGCCAEAAAGAGLRQRRDRARRRSLPPRRLGLRVPDDLAVTGWDDVMAARHSRPGLTTVRQPMRELGAWAARRLHERLAGDASEPRHEVLPTQLVQRASCGHHPEEDR